MDLRLKKWPLTALTITLTSSGALYADDAEIQNLKQRMCSLEQACCNGAANLPVNPPLCDGFDLFITADALWWSAQEGGLGYVYNKSVSTTRILNSGLKTPDTTWNWGFKLGIGYNMCHDSWDLYLNWTHFDDTSNGSETAPTGLVLFPVIMNRNITTSTVGITPSVAGTTIFTVNHASTEWKLELDLIDLELGRQFYISRWLTLRPHAGLRLASIEQHILNKFQGGNYLGTRELRDRFKNNFHGGGVRAGLDTQWSLGCGWSIYGDAALSLLYGSFNVKQRERLVTTPTSSTELLFFKDNYQLGRAAADLAIGVRWETFFCCDGYRLIAEIGWEQHQFFEQNMISKNVSVDGLDTQYSHSLATQGFTLELRLDF